MITLLFTLALNCPLARIVDSTQGTWGTPQDLEAFKIARERCNSLYGKEAPCLKKFEKTEVGTYRATCGKE